MLENRIDSQNQSSRNTKNNLNVFKRRTAFNISSKSIKDWKQNSEQKKFKKIDKNNQIDNHVQFFAKFQEFMTMENTKKKQKTIDHFKKQKKFEKIIRNIEPRGGSFYKFGFKSYEKSNKKLFSQVLNVAPRKMKGTMHLGQMWSTVQVTKFMRENKIFINKLKLIDKLKHAKQQQQRDMLESTTTIATKKDLSSRGIYGDSKNSISSRYAISKRKTWAKLQPSQLTLNSFRELNKTMDQINKKLKNLKPSPTTQRNIDKLKFMEECIQKMQQLDNQYHQQIGYWI